MDILIEDGGLDLDLPHVDLPGIGFEKPHIQGSSKKKNKQKTKEEVLQAVKTENVFVYMDRNLLKHRDANSEMYKKIKDKLSLSSTDDKVAYEVCML